MQSHILILNKVEALGNTLSSLGVEQEERAVKAFGLQKRGMKTSMSDEPKKKNKNERNICDYYKKKTYIHWMALVNDIKTEFQILALHDKARAKVLAHFIHFTFKFHWCNHIIRNCLI